MVFKKKRPGTRHIYNDSAKASKGLTEYLSRSSTMDRTNEERPNTQTDYENERRLCER